jgi:hypothetical protein
MRTTPTRRGGQGDVIPLAELLPGHLCAFCSQPGLLLICDGCEKWCGPHALRRLPRWPPSHAGSGRSLLPLRQLSSGLPDPAAAPRPVGGLVLPKLLSPTRPGNPPAGPPGPHRAARPPARYSQAIAGQNAQRSVGAESAALAWCLPWPRRHHGGDSPQHEVSLDLPATCRHGPRHA